MHVALVRRRFAHRLGGAERYAINFALGLVKRGHQVTIVAEELDQRLVPEAEYLPVHVGSMHLTSKTITFAKRAEAVLSSRQFDVVFGMARVPTLDVYRLTDRLHAHWMRIRYADRWQLALQRLNPRHRKLIALERSIFESESIQTLIVQSQLDRQLARHYYGTPDHRMCTIHNGVDTEVFHPVDIDKRKRVRAELGVDTERPLLVFAAANGFRVKGIDSILKALQHIPAVQLLVVGTDAKNRSAVRARELGLANRVFFVGYRNDIGRYLSAGDLFVFPSPYDPFPNVTLEAMACGVPVLISRSTGAAEIVQKGVHGYVLPMEDPASEIIERVRSYFGLPDSQRYSMRRSCRELAESMSLDEHIDRVISVFECARQTKLQAAA